MYPVAASRNRNWARAASFTGAYDATPSIVAAFSSRRTLSSYLGKPWRIRRDSDNDEMWSRFLGNGPHLDTAHTADFLNGANGYILRVADQTGTWIDDDNGTDGYDAVQTAEAARQPLYVASGQNGRPVLRFDGVDDGLDANLGAFNAPFSFFSACYFANVSQPNDDYDYIYSLGLGDVEDSHSGIARYRGGHVKADKYYLWEGANALYGPVIAGQVWRLFSQIIDTETAYHSLWENGTEKTVDDNNAAITTNGDFALGYYRPMSMHHFSGDIAEILICNAALSTGDRQAAETAMNDYWSIY